jgi:uncharacterized protein
MKRLKIAVVGSGVSGLSAAWLLSKSHEVTIFEQGAHLGGHAHTLDLDIGQPLAVDCGFIVYNEKTYPNLTALFSYLGVETAPSKMGFAVSLKDGAYEYSGSSPFNFVGSLNNLKSAAHWRMMQGMAKFLRLAKADFSTIDERLSLGAYMLAQGFSKDFIDLHLLPVAGAIWSSDPASMLDYPAKAFLQFFKNHGLLNYADRPQWRTVKRGSRNYIQKLIANTSIETHLNAPVKKIARLNFGVSVELQNGDAHEFDHVILATHADVALALLEKPSTDEQSVLSQFEYTNNAIFVHRDDAFMPKQKRHWSSWNYVSPETKGSLTYWMNDLQPLDTQQNIFVSLVDNCHAPPKDVLYSTVFRHPKFTCATAAAQRELWDLQGNDRVWFCGAYFGSGFHEDGLQSGLAVAEELGSVVRPWALPNCNDRLTIPAISMLAAHEAAE